MNTKSTYRRGFTLLEMTIVLAIAVVLITIVTPPFIKFRQQQALQNTTNAIVSVLSDARAKTFAALNNTSYSVKIESNQATLFTGTSYSSSDPTNDVYPFETPTTVTWSLAGGGSVISFDRLKGTTSQYGTITIQLPSGVTRVITITTLGTVARN